MKRVLILAIGCSLDPWLKMAETSKNTWDSISVDGVETVFYFGNPVKENTEKEIYFPIDESYFTMSEKMIQAFEWAIKNKKFDYIARINSSTYCNKKKLVEYIQALENENVFAGVEVEANPKWIVGWTFILSKDVVQKVVDNKDLINHTITDDLALSYLISELNIPYTKGKNCSIDRTVNGWSLIGYGSDTIEFTDFSDVKKLEHHFYRTKQDYDRNQDRYVMEQLFNILK